MRRYIMLIHLYLAAFVAPALLLVATSGGLYLLGIKGDTTKTTVELSAGSSLDFSSSTLKNDISTLLAAHSINHDFEYLKKGATSAQTRPTSRVFYEFSMVGDELAVTRHKPNLQKTMIELHKGHGPTLFKLYQKLVAVSLMLIVLSGLWMGITAKALRNKTSIAAGLGLAFFIILGFIA